MKRLPYLVLMLIPAILAVTMRASPPSQTAQPQQPDKDRYTAGGHLKKPSAYSGLPVVGDFQGTQEAAPDSERRQIREKRYNDSNLPRQLDKDPGLVVNGQTETTSLRFIDYNVVGSPDPRGIPVSTSTAIVVGTVTRGKCFITKNHTYVYTDYTVTVDQVLKQDSTSDLSVGGELVATREGGAIRYPSGHVTNVLTHGKGLPAIGSQYILFLWKSIPNFPEYEIIFDSGYQVKNGRVYPLDNVNSQYVGVELPVFLDEVQKAIAASQNKGGGQ
jgi:hypothetical protein